MTCRLVPVLAVALLAACHHNSADPAVYPDSPSASAAGDSGGRRGPGGRGEEMLLRGVTLSSDQQQHIESIRARYRAQTEQMRQQSGGDRAAMRDQMRSTMERQIAEIRAVLTEDQQRQFDQNVAEVRARRNR